MPVALNVEAAGRTNVGLVRSRNEDRFFVGRVLFAVADGLGGHPAGDVASDAVIEDLRPLDRPIEPMDLTATLGRRINTANRYLRQMIEADPQLAGMGTTLVALLMAGSTAVLANVGDSRAYLLRDTGQTVQITEDHVYGHLLGDAARVPNLPERLTRFLDGRLDGRSPDLTVWDLHSGDRFLLCSDGLSSFVPFDRIHATLSSLNGPTEAVDQLIALAMERGGPDNITVIVIDVK